MRRYAAMRAAKERKRIAASAGEPVRVSRITEVTIRDTHRPLAVFRFQREPTERGWGRAKPEQNGKELSIRPVATAGIARLLAKHIS